MWVSKFRLHPLRISSRRRSPSDVSVPLLRDLSSARLQVSLFKALSCFVRPFYISEALLCEVLPLHASLSFLFKVFKVYPFKLCSPLLRSGRYSFNLASAVLQLMSSSSVYAPSSSEPVPSNCKVPSSKSFLFRIRPLKVYLSIFKVPQLQSPTILSASYCFALQLKMRHSIASTKSCKTRIKKPNSWTQPCCSSTVHLTSYTMHTERIRWSRWRH